MNITDFGKNLFQSELIFKFDCVSNDFFLIAAKHFAQKKDAPWYVGKDPQSGQSLITTGDGSQQHPFLQIKLSADKIVIWAGWHVAYSAWQFWRNNVIVELASISETVPSIFVGTLTTHATITVPEQNLKKVSEIPEFQPLLTFARRYIPADYSGRGAGHSIFLDDSGNRVIETQIGGNLETKENTFLYLHRWLAVDAQKTVSQNLSEHFYAFDELFRKFHDNYVLLLLKK